MKIFFRTVILVYCVILHVGCNIRSSADRISKECPEVRTVATGNGELAVLYTYGIRSNQLLFVVIECGHKELLSKIRGELVAVNGGGVFGDPFLELSGLSQRLSDSKRLFLVDGERCFSVPLSMKLGEFLSALKADPFGTRKTMIDGHLRAIEATLMTNKDSSASVENTMPQREKIGR